MPETTGPASHAPASLPLSTCASEPASAALELPLPDELPPDEPLPPLELALPLEEPPLLEAPLLVPDDPPPSPEAPPSLAEPLLVEEAPLPEELLPEDTPPEDVLPDLEEPLSLPEDEEPLEVPLDEAPELVLLTLSELPLSVLPHAIGPTAATKITTAPTMCLPGLMVVSFKVLSLGRATGTPSRATRSCDVWAVKVRAA